MSLNFVQFAHWNPQVRGLPVLLVLVWLFTYFFYLHSTLIDGGQILEHFQDVLILLPFLHRNDGFISFYDLETIKLRLPVDTERHIKGNGFSHHISIQEKEQFDGCFSCLLNWELIGIKR